MKSYLPDMEPFNAVIAGIVGNSQGNAVLRNPQSRPRYLSRRRPGEGGSEARSTGRSRRSRRCRRSNYA